MRKTDSVLAVIVVLLALICAAGAVWLLREEPDPVPEPDSIAETSAAAATQTTAVQTTAATTAQTTAPIGTTTTSAPAETAPPTAEARYVQYVQETLIPKYGLAAEGIAEPGAQTGLAAAYVCDFLGKGTEDLLVIRLDALDGDLAAVPVLMWYTTYEEQIVLADTFESKLTWTGYCIRCEGQRVYISGEYTDAAMQPESWIRTEIEVLMQDNLDMILMNMEQEYAEDMPEQAVSADAALLLELRPDPAAETGRRYLLYDYTTLLDSH